MTFKVCFPNRPVPLHQGLMLGAINAEGDAAAAAAEAEEDAYAAQAYDQKAAELKPAEAAGNAAGGAGRGAHEDAAREQHEFCKYDSQVPSRKRPLSRLAAIVLYPRDSKLRGSIRKYDAEYSCRLAAVALHNANELHKTGFKVVVDAWPEWVCKRVFEHARKITSTKAASSHLINHLRPFPISNSTSEVTFTSPQSSLTPL